MKIQIPPDASPLYNYFGNTFVGKSDEFGYHDPPLSPIQMWNNFHLVADGIPRTPQMLWKLGIVFLIMLLEYCCIHHPTFWKLFESLIVEQFYYPTGRDTR